MKSHSSILAWRILWTEEPGTRAPVQRVMKSQTQLNPLSISSVTQSCPTLCNPQDWSMLDFLVFTSYQNFLKVMSIKLVMPSNHLILCHPLPILFSIFPRIRVFSKESILCIRWPKYWSFNFNIRPSIEHSGLISFRMDWLDLLAAQGTLKSLLQHHSSKASIIWPQLSLQSNSHIHT